MESTTQSVKTEHNVLQGCISAETHHTADQTHDSSIKLSWFGVTVCNQRSEAEPAGEGPVSAT